MKISSEVRCILPSNLPTFLPSYPIPEVTLFGAIFGGTVARPVYYHLGMRASQSVKVRGLSQDWMIFQPTLSLLGSGGYGELRLG